MPTQIKPQPSSNEASGEQEEKKELRTSGSTGGRGHSLSPKKKTKEFGYPLLGLALSVSILIAGINIAQRWWIFFKASQSEATWQWRDSWTYIDSFFSLTFAHSQTGVLFRDMLVLNGAMAAGLFSLTSVVLLFLSYESHKISIFIKGANKYTIKLYVVSIAFIELAAHMDSFSQNHAFVRGATNVLLLIVAAFETLIEIKTAACFKRLEHIYKSHAPILNQSAIMSTALFLINGFLVLGLIIETFFKSHIFENLEIVFLPTLILCDILFLFIFRRRLVKLRAE